MRPARRGWGEGTRYMQANRRDVCDYLERANQFYDPYWLPFVQSLPETLIEVPASIIPLFGRTQYRRGAVVFTLKHTFLSVGLESLRFVVTTSENGPVTKRNILKVSLWQECLQEFLQVLQGNMKLSLTNYDFLRKISQRKCFNTNN